METKGVFVKVMLITLELTAISILLGIVIGLVFALIKITKIKILEVISDTYVYLVRGTPLIVQIFILYFGIRGILLPAARFLGSFYYPSITYWTLYFLNPARGDPRSPQRSAESRTLFRKDKDTDIRKYYIVSGIPPSATAFRQTIYHKLKDSSLVSFISMNEVFNVATTLGSNNFTK